MNCPYCNYNDSKVIDSRDINDGIRRRRQCLKCDARFTTYERLQPASLFVIKKDLRREEFNKDKLLTGVRKACEKRPLAAGTVEQIANDIETELYSTTKNEVSTQIIGDMVMEKLKGLDYIAYIRFASIYRDFTDITALKREVDSLVGAPESVPAHQLSLLGGATVEPALSNGRHKNKLQHTNRR